MRWFISDLHLRHKNLMKWERTQFNSIEEHDAFIIQSLKNWREKKAKDGDTLWILGDLGDPEAYSDIHKVLYGDYFQLPQIFVHVVLGNHDKVSDAEYLEYLFDGVHLYPVHLSHRLVVSHEPLTVDSFTLNVHGHLHGAYLDSSNHFCVSANDVDYKPVKETYFNGLLGKLPPRNMKFLWEPYADKYIFKDKTREDIVCDPKSGKIDLSASRTLQKMKRDEHWNLKAEFKTS